MKDKIELLEKKISEFKTELEELKLSAKEGETFKVGDYVIMKYKQQNYCAGAGSFAKIQFIDINSVRVEWLCDKSNNQMNGTYNKDFFRKATVEEIETFLRSEAEKKGFVKGAKVKLSKGGGNASDYNVYNPYGLVCWEKLEFTLTGETRLWQGDVTKEYILCFELLYGSRKYFVYNPYFELIPSHPSITVGGEYPVEFKEDYINVGCKTIPSHEISNLFHALKSWNSCKQTHGEIECVQINGYEITVKKLEEIVNHFSK